MSPVRLLNTELTSRRERSKQTSHNELNWKKVGLTDTLKEKCGLVKKKQIFCLCNIPLGVFFWIPQSPFCLTRYISEVSYLMRCQFSQNFHLFAFYINKTIVCVPFSVTQLQQTKGWQVQKSVAEEGIKPETFMSVYRSLISFPNGSLMFQAHDRPK